MTLRYGLYLLACAVLGVLLTTVGGYSFLTWEFYVLSSPLWATGAILEAANA